MLREVNFDGLVGPTHHYGGLSKGNLASEENRQAISHPRQAALQGLAKMKLLMDLGVGQGVLPVHRRPHLGFLREQGFTGSNSQILERAARERPDLLSIAYSSSFMWAANAATVSPAADTKDGRVHFTPANLVSTPHRRLEAPETTRFLRSIFGDDRCFVVHDPLSAALNEGESSRHPRLADEGAANHTRLWSIDTECGIEIFTFGRMEGEQGGPQRYPARQTLEASQAIAVAHGLDPDRVLFVQQNPRAIDAGVFHNDVIAVGHENLLLCHSAAWADQQNFLERLRDTWERSTQGSDNPSALHVIEIGEAELPLEEVVRTYLFNSQLVTLPGGGMLLLAPMECADHPGVQAIMTRILAAGTPIREVRYVDVRQSMRNGGGPACLRLRVLLSEEQLEAVRGNVLLTAELYQQLVDWVQRNYREELSVDDLADPVLPDEVDRALEELQRILHV